MAGAIVHCNIANAADDYSNGSLSWLCCSMRLLPLPITTGVPPEHKSLNEHTSHRPSAKQKDNDEIMGEKEKLSIDLGSEDEHCRTRNQENHESTALTIWP